MSERRSDHTDNLLLIAATTIFVVTVQRYFQTTPLQEPEQPANGSEVASPGFERELSQHGRGRFLRCHDSLGSSGGTGTVIEGDSVPPSTWMILPLCMAMIRWSKSIRHLVQ